VTQLEFDHCQWLDASVYQGVMKPVDMDGEEWASTIGRVAFLNCDPLYHGLSDKWKVLPAPPAWLTGHLLRRDCIVAPIPAADYATNQSELILLPGIAIASAGEVGSVLLFSQIELDEIESIAIPSDSATSVLLLKHIMHKRGVNCSYIQMGPDLESMLDKFDAALLIGDRALVEAENNAELVKMDLGQEWMNLTGHPMVFGVFAARKDSSPDIVNSIHRELKSRLEAFESSERELVIKESSRRVGINENRIDRYFGEVINRLDESGILGLEKFLKEICRISDPIEFLANPSSA